ncbi:hypothetical protein B1812_17775 [Methylocystis bryophila]|uniref:Uncharacterized protein n=1 Tax=Methylocystis bryophila TaxID=655015 RepID=A0A1W6MYH4_9HYPH|nr:hypothetical protein B1812_17775 [Methylocystis bryophila]
MKNSRRTSPNYGYRDSISWPTTLALQMGSVGLIVGFEDFGFLEWWYDQNYGELLRGKCLHPAQFWEIAGRAVYAGGLGGWDVSYSIIENEKGMFITLDPRIREGHPEDPQRLADIVAAFTEIPDLAKIARPGTTPTLLIDKDGNYQDMPA